jgi:hypothetical protein
MPAGRGRNRAAGRRTALAHLVNAPTRKVRLRIATGPGSISAKTELTKLARTGEYHAAIKLARDHERRCGEKLASQAVIAAWQGIVDAWDARAR